MPIPKLDPRAARTDLTSRECSKIIGAVVNILKMQGHDVVEIRYAMVLLARMLMGRTDLLTGEEDVDKVALQSLRGIAGSLIDMAPAEAIQTAIHWWAECDKAWGLVEGGGPKGAN